jgi:predicted acylesterase/phospholipase RssA
MLSYTVPTTPLRQMGADRVLAVHLKGHWTTGEGPRHLFDVIGQCFSIAQEMNSHIWKQAADLIIEPDVNGYKYDAFEHAADLVRAGEIVTRAALPEIRKWLQTEPARVSRALKTPAVKPATMPAD